MYPYVAGSTGLTAVLPPSASAGGKLFDRLADPAERARIRAEVLEPEDRVGEHGTARHAGRHPGPRLKKPQNTSTSASGSPRSLGPRASHWLDAAMDLILSERQSIGTVYFMMNEENVKLQLRQPWIKFGTDADGVDPDHPPALTHPRAYGTFPRILGKYVRDEHVIPLEEAIRKMTSAVAARLSIRDRGLLARGLSRRRRRSSTRRRSPIGPPSRSPHQISVGVRHVFVNGTAVVREGQHTGAKPGEIVRGPGYSHHQPSREKSTSTGLPAATHSPNTPAAAAGAGLPEAAREVDLTWGVKIPLRDGVTLNATVYKPKPMRNPLPVICTMTPYIADTYHDRAMYFARNGYVFALVDVRGRGNSGGRFEPFAQDPHDGHDVVEWLAKQPWCNGQGRALGRLLRRLQPVGHAQGVSAAPDDDRPGRGRASGRRFPRPAQHFCSPTTSSGSPSRAA